ncbi:MAG: LD-carboxypeptidase [Lachnospiraceae bacterium]|nr:LD-carboxypeptidase [Lachnospiraceae bacterium]
MEKNNKVAIVCCSNGQPTNYRDKLKHLKDTLTQIGLIPVFSDFIYEKDSVFSGSGEERARCLMEFYRNDEIKEIYDISGGDIANEILPYLDFEIISRSKKTFWGYSDLTTIINAIYAKTGKKSVLYQIRNLIYGDNVNQISNFTSTIFNDTDDLFSFHYEFKQKDYIQGIVVGGNIRCLLKLAGTEYWPDMNQKILLLESFSGRVPQMVTYLNQLKQIGVFDKINGILLGTFTQMDEEQCFPSIVDLVRNYAGDNIPIAETKEIGHGISSKGIVIGEEICLCQ